LNLEANQNRIPKHSGILLLNWIFSCSNENIYWICMLRKFSSSVSEQTIFLKYFFRCWEYERRSFTILNYFFENEKLRSEINWNIIPGQGEWIYHCLDKFRNDIKDPISHFHDWNIYLKRRGINNYLVFQYFWWIPIHRFLGSELNFSKHTFPKFRFANRKDSLYSHEWI
jgi:hypothetical protein